MARAISGTIQTISFLEKDKMRCFWFLGCLAVTTFPTSGADNIHEANLPEGEWVVVGMEGGGYKASPEELTGMKWSIQGTKITAFQPIEIGKMEYKLDPEKTPKAINLTSLNGPLKGHTDPGIYELKDGQLRICYRDPDNTNGARPKTFKAATPANSGYGIIILRKVMK